MVLLSPVVSCCHIQPDQAHMVTDTPFISAQKLYSVLFTVFLIERNRCKGEERKQDVSCRQKRE